MTAHDNKVYVIGGFDGMGVGVARVDIFDASNNQWRQGPSLPIPLQHAAAASAGGKIYSIGGFLGSSFTATDAVFELDPNQVMWVEKAPLPSARGALAAVEIEGRIYAAGGTEVNGADSNRLTVYDPATDQWTELAPMPTFRNHLAAGAIAGKLYVIGGRSPNLATLEVYDPGTDQWETATPMPTARSGLAAAVFQDLLFVFGGEIPGVFNQTEVYDPLVDAWFSLAPMPLPRHGIGAAVVGNRIIIPGGGVVAGFGATGLCDEIVVLPHATTLAQFADAERITSQILLSNYGPEPATAILELRGADGSDLAVALDPATDLSNPFTIAPRQSLTLTTRNQSNPAAEGSAQVFSDRPLLAEIIFSGEVGFAGVLGRPPSSAFGVPVQIDTVSGLSSGIAIANASPFPNRVVLVLLDAAGGELARADVNLPAGGQIADLLDELFTQLPEGSFRGSVIGRADLPIGAMAILLRSNQLATLPVQTEGVF